MSTSMEMGGRSALAGGKDDNMSLNDSEYQSIIATQMANVEWGEQSIERQKEMREAIEVYRRHRPDSVDPDVILQTYEDLLRKKSGDEEPAGVSESMDEETSDDETKSGDEEPAGDSESMVEETSDDETKSGDEEPAGDSDAQKFLIGYMLTEQLTVRVRDPPSGWMECSTNAECSAIYQYPFLENQEDATQLLPNTFLKNMPSDSDVKNTKQYVENVLREVGRNADKGKDIDQSVTRNT